MGRTWYAHTAGDGNVKGAIDTKGAVPGPGNAPRTLRLHACNNKDTSLLCMRAGQISILFAAYRSGSRKASNACTERSSSRLRGLTGQFFKTMQRPGTYLGYHCKETHHQQVHI